MKIHARWVLLLVISISIVTFFLHKETLATNPNLKYFGFYFDQGAAISNSSNLTWVNLTYDFNPAAIETARSQGRKVIVTLYGRSGVDCTWGSCTPSAWAKYAQQIQPYINDVAAFSVADEPDLYPGLTWDYIKSALESTASTIKGTFPNTPVWVNFGNIPLLVGPSSLPTGYDWYSFDCYESYTNCGGNGYTIPELVSKLRQKIGGKKIVLIPQSFTKTQGISQEEVVSMADQYYNLAQASNDIVAIIPYMWQTDNAGGLTGADNLSLVREKYRIIGTQIRNSNISTPTAAPTISSFTTSTPEITLGRGEYATLSWSVSGATSVSISPSVGNVTGTTSTIVTPTTNTTFTLTASNSGGSTTATVTVGTKSVTPIPTISSFVASPPSIITGRGEYSTLSWSVSGADTLTISPHVGTVSGNSTIVTPTSTTTFTLTATNSSGSSTASVIVTASSASMPSIPVISSFTASPPSITSGRGEYATLSWSVSGATNVSISPSVGTVTGNTSTIVTPNTTMTFTLTATNDTGSSTASTVVTVNTPQVYPYPTPYPTPGYATPSYATPSYSTPLYVSPLYTTPPPGYQTPVSTYQTPTVKVTYNFGTVTLRNGSRGEAVKELQRFLNKILNLGLVIDGKLGPKTIAVIKVWQKNNGLVPDGLIGPKTKAMMNASVN